MAVFWRAVGTLNLDVGDGQVTLSQDVEAYDDGDPGTTLAADTITAKRNFDRVKADAVNEVRSMIDDQWVPLVNQFVLLAKRNQQANAFEAQATAYIATKQAAQAGV